MKTLKQSQCLILTAARVIGDRTEAEDLIQETYLQGWKSFHRFEPGTNRRAWLFKILFHVIHHHRRKWFSLNLVKDGEELLEEVLTYEPPIPEHLTDEDVLAALDKIPTDFREGQTGTLVAGLKTSELRFALLSRISKHFCRVRFQGVIPAKERRPGENRSDALSFWVIDVNPPRENPDSLFRGNDGLVVAACPAPLQSSVRVLQLCDRIEHFLKLPHPTPRFAEATDRSRL